MQRLTFMTAAACVALTLLTAPLVQAEPVAAGRRAAVVADGQGNAAGAAQRGFNTSTGAQGLRTTRFQRSSDGSASTTNTAHVSGANGSAGRNGSATRNVDGTASGERSTTVTNANTGVTFDGSTTYSSGNGISRSASCKDANGNAVSCGAR